MRRWINRCSREVRSAANAEKAINSRDQGLPWRGQIGELTNDLSCLEAR